MIPKLNNDAQTFIYGKTWKEITEKITEYWDKDYLITDFDYGDGMYRVLLSKGTGWNGQSYRCGKKFPKEKIRELWDKGYEITNVTHDGSDWIVIMSGSTGITRGSQTWFTKSSFNDFKKKVKEEWAEGNDITKVAYGNGLYLGVTSGGLGWSQTWWNWPDFPTDELMDIKKSDGKIITDAFEFGNKCFTIASGKTGYKKQRFHKNKDFEYLRKLLKNRWGEGYCLTTVSFFKGEWILIFSK